MTNLFQVLSTGNRGLNKTAELTAIAEKITTEVFNKIGNSLDEAEKNLTTLKAELDQTTDDAAKKLLQAQINDEQAIVDGIYTIVEASKESHDSMDKLITDNYNLSTVDVEFLKTEDDATIDKMIKSQQSKRSRAKSKAMTQENFNTLMVGAVSENLLRLASGKEKTSSGHSGNVKPIEYDEATIAIYKSDKDKLSKEIRNIQSKKSIMKSKANFEESSEAYQKLLAAEAMLKQLRGDAVAAAVVKEVVPEYVEPLVAIKAYVDNEVATADITKMKANDAKDILNKIISLMAAVEVPTSTIEDVTSSVDEEAAATNEEVNE